MIRFSFLGDISLNDRYIDLYHSGVNPFSEVQDILKESDFVIGNLECMAKGVQGENLLKKPRLSTTLETLNYLKALNMKAVTLAHNHIYDHLEDGFNKTTAFLVENQVQYLGASLEKDKAGQPLIFEKESIRIGLLNYVTADTNPNLPDNAQVYLNLFDADTVIDDIIKIKPKVDHVVLILHWGGRVEGGLFPDWDQPGTAYRLIDAGADLIIGHHSHTFQPFEIYKGKHIFYSLGNFCFSDYWFEGQYHPMASRRKISTMVKIDFYPDSYAVVTDYLFNTVDGFRPLKNYHKTVRFRNSVFKLLKKNKMVWKLYFFHKQFILPVILFFKRKDISFSQKLSRFTRSLTKKLFQ